MIDFDSGALKELERDFEVFAKRTVPFAVRNALNESAFQTQKIARDFIGAKMIERNQWTRRSVQVDRATGLNVDFMAARTGSTEDYLKTQEFGGTETKKGKHGVAIPTPFASGEQTEPRRRTVRKANRLSSIQLRRSGTGATRRQRNIATIRAAAEAGGRNRFVFMDTGRGRKGIFKVFGTKRRPKVRMIHDLSRPVIVIRPRPWLGPAVSIVRNRSDQIYFTALVKQAQRNGLFGY